MGRKAELATGFHDRETYQADLEPVTAHVVAQYHNDPANGGSSFRAYGGEMATGGYIVGGHQGVPERKLHSKKITAEEYQEHRDYVRAHTQDANVIAGTWANDEGDTDLDASNVVEEREEAKRLQRQRKQKAVWNATAGKEEDLR